MLNNFRKEFYKSRESKDEMKFEIKPANTKELNILQTVISGPFSGINGIIGLKISYQLDERAIIYRINLDAEAKFSNGQLSFWIPYFETKPIKNRLKTE